MHIVVAEDLVVHAGRDGGLKTMEIQGILKLRISDPDYGYIKVQVRHFGVHRCCQLLGF